MYKNSSNMKKITVRTFLVLFGNVLRGLELLFLVEVPQELLVPRIKPGNKPIIHCALNVTFSFTHFSTYLNAKSKSRQTCRMFISRLLVLFSFS